MAITDTANAQTVSLQGDVTLTSGLTTANSGSDNYNVSLTGASNSIAGTTTFAQGGTLTLGDGTGDSTDFAGGLVATAPSSISAQGTVKADGGTGVLTLGDADTGVTVAANLLVGGTSTGTISLGDATVADAATLTVGAGAANQIDLDAVSGTAAGTPSNLTLNTTGAVTVAEAVGTDIGIVTVTQSGGTTFSSTVGAAAVTLTDTTGTIQFDGALTATDLNTAVAGYNVSILGGSTITNGVTFSNTGTTQIGDATGDTNTFNGGVTATAGAVTASGTIATSEDALALGAVTLVEAQTLTLDTAETGAGAITVASLTGVDGGSSEDVTLTSGSGTITVSGAIGTDIGTLTLQENDAGATGAVSLQGSVAAGTLTTFAQAYDVSLTGAVNAITADTTFLNTGAITIGDAAGDSSTFAGGLDTTAGGTENFAGTVQTEGSQMDLGAVTLAAATTLKTDGNSATGDANINIGTVGVTSNDNLTITSTGTIDFQGAVNLGTGDLDVTIDTATEGTDTLVIDQTITANAINFTGSGDAGGDTLDINQNLAAGTSLTLDNLQTVAVALDVDLSAANGNISATTNIGSITLDGTAGENEIKTTGGTGIIALGAIGNSGTASDLIVTTAAGTTSGDITLNGDITAVGYVTLNAGSTASGNTGDVTINANVTAGDANGVIGIDIDATNNIVVNAGITTADGGTAQGIDLDSANTGTVTFGAAGTLDSDTTASVTGAAGVAMASGSSITADTTAEVIATSGNITLSQINAGTTATLTASAGSITDGNGNTNNVTATTLMASAANLIGNANDNVLLDPGGSGFDALETAVSNLTVSTTAASSDIAINNSIGSTLTVTSAIPDSDGTGTLWIKNDNGLTVSAWTLDNDDNIALLATSGNITIPDGGAGVVDASGNLATADISLGSSTTNTVRLEAASGLVQDSAANALVIAANDLLIKTNTLNSETTGTAVGNFGTTDVELAVQLNGKLDIDVNSDTQDLRILGANTSGSATDLDIGDVDGDGNAITTNGGTTKGDLSVTVLNGTSVNSDDSVESSPTLSVFDRINTNNGDISLLVYSGNSQDHGNIQIESGATVQSDGTNDKQGTSTISGDVKVIGQVFANTGESVSIEGADSNIIIDVSGVAGSGVLTLAPGAGYDVILEAGANVSVSSGGGNAGNLVIKNARNVTMDATATVVVDGSVDIGHGTVTGGVADSVTGVVQLSNVTLDDNGDGDGTSSIGLFVKSGGDVILVGAIDANADPDNAQLANDVILVSGGSITNTSSASIAIGEVDDLTLTAVDEIGANGANITVNASTISASSTSSGDIYISNDPQVMSQVAADNIVTISGISATSGSVSYVQSAHDLSIAGDIAATGAITVQTTGDLTVNAGDIATSGANTILVQADSDTTGAGNLVINSAGSSGDEKIRTGSGTVQLRGEHLSFKDYSVKTAGEINAVAGQGASSTGDIFSDATSNSGNYDLSGGFITLVANGSGIGFDDVTERSLYFSSTGAVNADADGAITLNSIGDLSVGAIEIFGSRSDLKINSTGDITDADNGTGGDFINVAKLTVVASDEIGSTGKNGALEFDASTLLLATSNTAGGVFLNSTGDGTLTVTDLHSTGSGHIELYSNSDTTLTSLVVANGSVTVDAAGALTATAVSSTTDSDVNDISLTGSSLAIGIVNAGSFGDATLDAEAGAITQTGTLTANDLVADAAGAITLVTDVDAANVSTSESGAITITQTGAIDLADVDTSNGSITVIATGGAITATDIASLSDSDSNDISLTGVGIVAHKINAGLSGDVTLNAGTGSITQDGTDDKNDVSADVLTADATTGINLDVTANSADLTVSGSGDIVVDEFNGITLTSVDTNDGSIDIDATSLITATSVIAGGAAGDSVDLTTSSGGIEASLVQAADAVSMTAGTGDINIGSITATAGTIQVLSTLGSINDLNDDDLADFTAGGTITLTALSNIGLRSSGTDLDIEFAASSVVDVSSTASGLIDLHGLGDITLANIDTANGSITVDAGGVITATNVVSTVSLEANDITLNGTSVALGTINAGTLSADVFINSSAGAITDADPDAGGTDTSVNITADSLTITGNQAVTSIETNIGTLALTTGATSITETNGVNIEASTISDNFILTASGAVTDTGKLAISGTTDITATGQTVALDDETNEFGGTVSVVAGATTLKDADNLVAVLNTTGTTDLTAVGTLGVSGSATGDLTTTAAETSFGATTVGGNLGVTAGGDVTDTGKLAIAGATTISASGQDITLDEAASTYGDFTITADEVYVADAGSLTASSIQANKVQLKGGSGVLATSTGVTEFAAESDTGDISITNTGGYAISDFASDSGITGVRFTDSDATGTITLIANSPLTINAPVDAGKGALQLTAVGSASTDNVTVNEAISGGAIAVDAGNSIAVNSGGVTSTSLSLTASNDISVNTPIIATTANLNAGNQISLESGSSVSASTFNVTSTKLKVDPSASVPAFNFSGGAEGDPSFDRNGRVQGATQNDWNSYFRASGTVVLAYDSAGDVVLDQMILSFIENEAAPVNSGEVELEEEE
ncbi:hypothetical protein N9N55_02085 [Opitutales bacterium]|nr:hypothetical protein [Opitutales bacterium]